jgi:hypothetical protein
MQVALRRGGEQAAIAEPSARAAARHRALFFMVGVLLFAGVCYLAHLNSLSFWEDESWMAEAVKGDLVSVWQFATARGVHPPLYFYIGWLYARLAGNSEVALRWLSGLSALLGIAWTYRLGADLFNRRAGAFAALLAAGSLFLIYFARMSRQYAFFFALAAGLVWAYGRWRISVKAERPSQTRWLVAIAGLQAALLYTHYFGVFMLPVLALHAAFTLPRRAWLRLWLALAAGAVLFLPWVPSVLEQRARFSAGLAYATKDWDAALRAYFDRVFNGSYPLGILLALIGVIAVWRWRRAGLLLLWLTLPAALALALNTRYSWFIERNMIFTLGGACVLFGAGLAWLSRSRLGSVAAVLAAVAFASLGLLNYDTYWPYSVLPWRDMGNVVARDARPDDVYVMYGEPYSISYYLNRLLGRPVHVLSVAEWLQHADKPARIWLMDAHYAVRFEAIDALPGDAVLTRRYVLGALVTEFYQRPPAQPITTFGGQVALGYAGDVITAKPGDTLNLDLWWRAIQPPQMDYSVGLYLLGVDGRPLAQQDGGFDGGRVPATALPLDRWTPDARRLTVPPDLAPGEYPLVVAVYDWHDGSRLIPERARPDSAFLLTTVRVSP